MSSRTRTLNEVRRLGLEALCRELGPVDAVRFLQQFDAGSGDYTRDRDEALGEPTVDEVLAKLEDRRQHPA